MQKKFINIETHTNTTNIINVAYLTLYVDISWPVVGDKMKINKIILFKFFKFK